MGGRRIRSNTATRKLRTISAETLLDVGFVFVDRLLPRTPLVDGFEVAADERLEESAYDIRRHRMTTLLLAAVLGHTRRPRADLSNGSVRQ